MRYKFDIPAILGDHDENVPGPDEDDYPWFCPFCGEGVRFADNESDWDHIIEWHADRVFQPRVRRRPRARTRNVRKALEGP